MSAPERLWSVTTLIKEGVPKGDALTGWAVKVTANYALDRHAMLGGMLAEGAREEAYRLLSGARWNTLKTAAARGTDLHEYVEKKALGLDPTLPEGLNPGFVEQYERFLAEHEVAYEMAEAAVFNRTYRYAGTLDSIARVDGVLVLLDVKTTDKGPEAKSRPPYPEIALQLAAYRHAEYVRVGVAERVTESRKRYYVYDPDATYVEMPPVEGALALVISPVDYTLTPVRTDQDVFDVFLHAREIARWSLEGSKTVLGAPVTATREGA